MTNDTDRVEHLKMIQEVIKRVADNSAQIKRWTIVVLTAAIALSASEGMGFAILLCIFPCVMLWWMDSYYLTQEKQYRLLFDDVRFGVKTDFDMCSTGYRKELPRRFGSVELGTMLTVSESRFYISLILILVVVGVVCII